MNCSFVKVAAVSAYTAVGDLAANLRSIERNIEIASAAGAGLIVFPELSLTGYSCQDLFFAADLPERVEAALSCLCKATEQVEALVFVGAPIRQKDCLYNCAVVFLRGRIIAVIPKTYIPDYDEFFEQRYFTAGFLADFDCIKLAGRTVPFGNNIILQHNRREDFKVACEICEDLWSTLSPSTLHALAGANIVCNLSASNDYLGKACQRRELIRAHSKKAKLAYIYTSAGKGESTADVVYSGYKAVAELGELLTEGGYERDIVYGYVDLEQMGRAKLRQSRLAGAWPGTNKYLYIDFELELSPPAADCNRYDAPNPFLAGLTDKNQELGEMFELQKKALHNRLSAAHINDIILGLSGGLDSTLAFLVAAETARENGYTLHVLSMPCFGTSRQTKSNAQRLAEAAQVQFQELDITQAAIDQLALIGHQVVGDVTYENVQARQRTMILLNKANQLNALVLGTADLSETALGFCTYGGDHLSMYNINASIPKTLVRELVLWYAAQAEPNSAAILRAIVATPISPELLPTDVQGNIAQSTEQIVGSYEIIDYILYYHVHCQFSQAKIAFLAQKVFGKTHGEAEVRKALDNYFGRFYRNQFKRTCAPDGAKVTEISLSPRSSWRMPADL